MKLGPHLHRIGNDIVAAYLVETPEGITVIDAGLPGHWRDLQDELTAMSRPIDDIRGVILTHGDSDHIGFAERLRREHGVPVYVHAADADRARGGDDAEERHAARCASARRWASSRTRCASAAMRDDAISPRWSRSRTATCCRFRALRRSSGCPGHSPGSIAVHVPIAEAVFVGDALTTRHVLTGRTGGQPAPFTDEPARALDSLGAHRGARRPVGAAGARRAVARVAARPRRRGEERRGARRESESGCRTLATKMGPAEGSHHASRTDDHHVLG